MTFGRTSAIWRRKNGSQAAISSSSGLRLFGRAALDHVGDVDVLASEAHPLRDDVGQQPSGAADERDALSILVLAGTFSDEHHGGVRIADTEDDGRSSTSELAARAVAEHITQLVERRGIANGGFEQQIPEIGAESVRVALPPGRGS